MRCRGRFVAGLFLAAALSGCGSTSHKAASVSGASATATTSGQASSANTAVATRTIRTGEFPGFNASAPVVETDPQTWVAVDQFDPAQRAAITARLQRLGFLGAAREDLIWSKAPTGSANVQTAGLSVVEQFRSAAAARAEYAAELPSLGPGTPIAVPGVPEARGFASAGNGPDDANILFADGQYVYLVGAEWAPGSKPAPTRANVIAAVQHLYRRLHQ